MKTLTITYADITQIGRVDFCVKRIPEEWVEYGIFRGNSVFLNIGATLQARLSAPPIE